MIAFTNFLINFFRFCFLATFKVMRVMKYLVENVSHGIKEWSQLHLIKVIGLLACAFMFIPSADAVDALKTCACLLKECK